MKKAVTQKPVRLVLVAPLLILGLSARRLFVVTEVLLAVVFEEIFLFGICYLYANVGMTSSGDKGFSVRYNKQNGNWHRRLTERREILTF